VLTALDYIGVTKDASFWGLLVGAPIIAGGLMVTSTIDAFIDTAQSAHVVEDGTQEVNAPLMLPPHMLSSGSGKIWYPSKSSRRTPESLTD
jgi:hypothetical protein